MNFTIASAHTRGHVVVHALFATQRSHEASTHKVRGEMSVAISVEGRRLSATHADSLASEATKSTNELKAYIKSLNFERISSNEMKELGGKLYATGDFSPQQISSFLTVDIDTEPPRNPSEPLDVTKHFNEMAAVASNAAKKDAGFKFGENMRNESVALLAAVISFANSDRSHVMRDS